MTTPHRIVNPSSLSAPVGFSHAVVATAGRTVYLGGQTGHDAAGKLVGAGLVEQFGRAADNVVAALDSAGARPEQLVSMQIFVTDVAGYRDALGELGAAYRERFGKHYPATALFGVTELFDPDAKVELVCIAVVPNP
jgi:enamine deaminase RidA (YjgF/YER057c/UK114 family)